MKLLQLILTLFAALWTTSVSMFAGEKKVYAVFDGEKTLTYYYDDQMDYRVGTKHEYNPAKNLYLAEQSGVQHIHIDASMKNASLTSMSKMFCPVKSNDNEDELGYFEICSSVTGLENLNTSQVTDMSYMFYRLRRLSSLDLSSFNTANVTDMREMFYYCESLTSIDLSSFNTANVTDMREMFYCCESLTSIDLSSFNTANVTDMSRMFYSCESLTSIDLSSFNTANVTDMRKMFCDCKSLTSLDVSHFNNANVTEMRSMFEGCSRLSSLDLSSFNTANVTDMRSMFDGCHSLTSLDLSHFNTANVTDMSYMFHHCESLVSLDVSHFNTEKVWYMDDMFYGCESLTSLDVSHFKARSVCKMNSMFEGCSALTTIDITGFNFSNVLQAKYLFYNCSNLSTIYCNNDLTSKDRIYWMGMFGGCKNLVGGKGTVYNSKYTDNKYARLDGGTSLPGYFTPAAEVYTVFDQATGTLTYYYDDQIYNRPGINEPYRPDLEPKTALFLRDYDDDVTKVVIDASMQNASLTSMRGMFRGGCYLRSLASIEGLSNLNTANVTDMAHLFDGCESLTSIDLSSFNTANVTDMMSMFKGCSRLSSLDLSSFNTANVTDMSYMFDGCESLTSLDVSSFNTANVTDMSYMFEECRSLTSLDVSRFNTANVTDMKYLFFYCKSLTSLDVSSFNTANVTDMKYMFYGCESLTSLDVSRFNTANVTDMGGMFGHCIELTSVDIRSFDIGKVQKLRDMFLVCQKLTTIYCNSYYCYTALRLDAVNTKNMFLGCLSLKGNMGTTYHESMPNLDFAHPDEGVLFPGYFTADKKVYTVYDLDHTLTYYCDQKMEKHKGLTELYDPYKTRFADYHEHITKVVIDESMRDTALTTTRSMFFGTNGKYLFNLHTIEGLENLDVSEVTDMSMMFHHCESLVSLDLSSFNTTEKLKDVSNMFESCFALKEVDLSGFNTSGVTNMEYMFADCISLTSLNLLSFNPKSVANTTNMFKSCTSLKAIYNNRDWSKCDQLTSHEHMFYNCTQLKGGNGTAYYISYTDKYYARPDEGTKKPGYFTKFTYTLAIDGINYAIDEANNTVELIPMPGSVKYSGDIVIPEKVMVGNEEYTLTKIGDNAFKDCDGITSITIEAETPPVVGDGAFDGVPKNIDIIVSFTSTDEYMEADGWSDFENIHSPQTAIDCFKYEFDDNTWYARVAGLTGDECGENIVIPEEVAHNGYMYKVGYIAPNAFRGNKNLVSITLPATILGIGDYAIFGNPKLTSINISAANEHYCDIEGVVFSKDGKNLLIYPTGRYGVYYVPEGTEKIEHNVFNGCNLNVVKLPSTLKEIGDFAFDQTNLIKMTSKADVPPAMSEMAFYNVDKNIQVCVPSGHIDDYKAATGWKEFTNIQAGVIHKVEIGNLYYDIYVCDLEAEIVDAKSNISGTVVLPETVEHDGQNYSVTSIGSRAFFGCEDIAYLGIPASISNIEDQAFYGCMGMNGVAFHPDCKIREIKDFTFAKCLSMGEVTLPVSVTEIGNDAFAGCSSMDWIVLPDAVRSIGDGAFDDCAALTGIEMGPNVERIGQLAFVRCESLAAVYLQSRIPPTIANDAFNLADALTEISVPCGTLEAYKNARGWRNWTDIIGYEPLSYHYSITAMPSEHGTITVPTNVCDPYLVATPDDGYRFVKWTDDNTENPRLIESLSANMSVGAVFEIKQHKWMLESRDDEYGLVSSPLDNGLYDYGTALIASATPKNGYKFVKWNDGTAITPYNLTLEKDTFLRAIFIEEDKEPDMPQFTMQVASAKIHWMKVKDGYTYSLTVYLNEDYTNMYGTYIFDRNGYIIDFIPVPKAPARNKEHAQEDAFEYIIDGLTADTKYYYRMVTRAEDNKLLYTDAGSFRTLSPAVENVITRIDAIGEVTYNGDSEAMIYLARSLYDDLTDEQKEQVTNYSTLTAAEETLAQLKAAAEAEEFAGAKSELAAVIAELQVLKQYTDEMQATIASYILDNAIHDADAVLNSTTVTVYEVEMATEKATLVLQEVLNVLLDEAQDQLKDALDALLLPDDNEDCYVIIKNAKDAVDELCLDSEKDFVENIETLIAAGEAIFAQAVEDLEAQRKTDQPQAIENVQSDNLQSDNAQWTKVLHNGQLYLMYEDRIYDVRGARVK